MQEKREDGNMEDKTGQFRIPVKHGLKEYFYIVSHLAATKG
jgi:hypothetical protein